MLWIVGMIASEAFEIMSSHEPIAQGSTAGIRYSSRLMAALNRFTGNLAAEAPNPMVHKYGRAYDHLIAADALRYREELDAALTEYRQAIDLRQDFVEAHIGVGKCLRRKGEFQDAVGAFKRALSQNAFNKEVHLDIGKCYNDLGLVKQAIAHYERAVKLDPTFLEAKFGLALIVELQGDTTYAMRLYKEIVALDEEFLPAYNNLGSIHLRLCAYDDARKVFEELVERSPEFGRGHLGLALTLDRMGSRREALTAYHRVLTLKPTARNAEFIQRRIVALNTELGRSKTRNGAMMVRVK